MIEWGPQIDGAEMKALNLPGETPVFLCEPYIKHETYSYWNYNCNGYRLPADHPYYLATSKGFTYWPGGDDAPCDWDGGSVLYKCGAVQGEGIAEDWFAVDWGAIGTDSQIIGYRPTAITETEYKTAPAHPLRAILDEAFEQAEYGKGAERHANGKPWDQQPIAEIGRMVGVGFNTGQAIKKLQESSRMEPDAACRELLGAIVYAASAIMLIREKELAKCQ